jgi:hypothetical protein
MTSVLPSHPTSRLIQVQERLNGGPSNKFRLFSQPNFEFSLERSFSGNERKPISLRGRPSSNAILLRAVSNGSTGEGSSDDEDKDQGGKSDKEEVKCAIF